MDVDSRKGKGGFGCSRGSLGGRVLVAEKDDEFYGRAGFRWKE